MPKLAKALPLFEQSPLNWSATGLHAGVDEAGRGPLAGPVVAAAVILDDQSRIEGLRDSKKLSAQKRECLYDEIMGRSLCCSLGWASAKEIDEINILQATLLAMKRAIEGLRLKPAHVWVDGNQLPAIDIPADALIGGDDLKPCISAASIIAKVTRDRWMREQDALYPQYGFAGHKGYGTQAHIEALKKHGACPLHRRSFEPVVKWDAYFKAQF